MQPSSSSSVNVIAFWIKLFLQTPSVPFPKFLHVGIKRGQWPRVRNVPVCFWCCRSNRPTTPRARLISIHHGRTVLAACLVTHFHPLCVVVIVKVSNQVAERGHKKSQHKAACDQFHIFTPYEEIRFFNAFRLRTSNSLYPLIG